MMIRPNDLLRVCGLDVAPSQGGQELLLYEILALVMPHQSIWVPFPKVGATLVRHLRRWGKIVYTDSIDKPPKAECIYFGTPTIVDGKELFPDLDYGERWSVAKERATARGLCRVAESFGYRLVISGLGSGDIPVEERLEDMGGGKIVAFKRFDTFSDWVLARRIEDDGDQQE